MRRLFWLAAGLALLATGVWLAGRPPSAYFLEKEGVRYQEERKRGYDHLRYLRARASPEAAPDLDKRMNDLLRETRTLSVRGYKIVLVPAGARAPGSDFKLAVRFDPKGPPPFEYVDAWIRPEGWLAKAFAGR